MTIDEARNQLSAYLDGELDEATRRAVAEALAAHPELRAELDTLRRTADLVSAMPRIGAPDGFAERVAAAVQADAQPSPLRRWRHLVTAAAACLVVGIAAWIALQPHAPRSKACDITTQAPAPETTVALLPFAEKEEKEAPIEEAADRGPAAARPARKPAAPARPPALDYERGRGLADRHAKKAPKAQPAPAVADEPTNGRLARRAERPAVRGKGVGESYEQDEFKAKARRATGGGKELAKTEEAVEGLHRVVRAPALPRAKLGRGAARNDLAEKDDWGAGQRADSLAIAHETLVAAILERQHTAHARETRRQIAGQPSTIRSGADRSEARPPTPQPPPKPLAEPKRAFYANGDYKHAARVVADQLIYDDLHQCLADVQSALRDANVPFAIQPLGSGHFVIEADMAGPEASALLARLGRPTPRHRLRKSKPAGPPPATGAASARTGAAGYAGRQAVHLVLHFRPGRPLPPPAAQQTEQRQAAPSER